MSADLIRWEPNGAGMLAGYVGTVGACLLEIFEPDARDGEWILQSFLHGQAGRLTYGGSADELKQRAEELLQEFASSLGAVFPDADRWQSLRDWLGGQHGDGGEGHAYRSALAKMRELES